MRIIAFSDSHGNYRAAQKVILRNPDASIYVHLGDGEKEVQTLRSDFPRLDIRNVSGNCDFGKESSFVHIIDVPEARIFCVHGHRHGVKSELDTLRRFADENNCNIVLFGHTHKRYENYSDGIYFLNPGSCYEPRDGKPPSFGYIDITEAGIFINTADLYV